MRERAQIKLLRLSINKQGELSDTRRKAWVLLAGLCLFLAVGGIAFAGLYYGLHAVSISAIGLFSLSSGSAVIAVAVGLVAFLACLKIFYTLREIPECTFFDYQNIQSAVIPESVESIACAAFGASGSFSRLRSVTLPEGIKRIDSLSFVNCHYLVSMTIKAEQIGDSSFRGCKGLKSIDLTGVTVVGSCAFWQCSSLASVVMSGSVRSIGDGAFRECARLEKINLSDVCMIGERAFYASGLTSVDLPNSVYSIGKDAFMSCEHLQEVVCSLNQVDLLRHSGISFDNVTVVIRDSADRPLGYDFITKIRLTESITFISDQTFNGWSMLESIELSNGLTRIGDGAFRGCSRLQSVVIPGSVDTIGGFAFRGCSSLQSVVIQGSVGEIGHFAFACCDGLQSVVIPDSVRQVADGAFNGCTALKVVLCSPEILERLQQSSPGVFDNVLRLDIDFPKLTLCLPRNTQQTYHDPRAATAPTVRATLRSWIRDDDIARVRQVVFTVLCAGVRLQYLESSQAGQVSLRALPDDLLRGIMSFLFWRVMDLSNLSSESGGTSLVVQRLFTGVFNRRPAIEGGGAMVANAATP